ncbi:Hypothetical protein PHPALM_19886 [Phytophthora palmivora]|uniref:Reverse transcriptase n=1 Tax=Phytophthora palmivora TaxID=4796 RepID=A0A2P4XG98_9STRA|nr:Hypothetical protein PHPALM_19886 [Phytophthora palmivora]
MISSGNALPPPAYGVVCDIDVVDHSPIKQRARRVALKYLKPLYQIVTSEIYVFSKGPWASPIIIVLKKNGYVQPKGGWPEFARRIRRAEEVAATQRQSQEGDPTQPPSSLTKFAADNRALAELDPLQELIDSPEGDKLTCGEPDQSVLTPVFTRRLFVDDICFGGATFDESLETLDRLLTRLAECRISVSFSKSIFVQPKVDFLSYEVTSEGIRADPKKTLAIAELPFPKSKKGAHYGGMSNRKVDGRSSLEGSAEQKKDFDGNKDLSAAQAAFDELKSTSISRGIELLRQDSDFDGNKDLSAAQAAFTELKSRVATAPILRHFDSAKEVHIMLFANNWQ